MSVEQASQTYQKCLNELVDVYKNWIIKRRKAINLLKEIVKDMDSGEFTGNVANIVGSSVGLAGGTMVIAGLLLAPLTAGASFAVAGAGLGASFVGGATNLTSDTLAENFATRKCKEADDEIKADQERSKKLTDAEEKLTEAIIGLQKEADAMQIDIDTLLKIARKYVTKDALDVLKSGRRGAILARAGYRGFGGAMAMATGRAMGKFNVALVGLGIVLDIWQIVSSGKDLSNGSKSKLGKGITKHISEWEESLNAVQKFFSETYGFNY